MLSSVNYCIETDPITKSELYVLGVQATVSAFSKGVWVDPLVLNYIGTRKGTNPVCDVWNIEPGHKIDGLVIHYDVQNANAPIQFLSIIAGLDFLMLGNQQKSQTTVVKELRPTSDLPVYGFNGYMSSGLPIKDLGFVKYEASCDPNPGVLPSNMPPPAVESATNWTLVILLIVVGLIALAAIIVPIWIFCLGQNAANQVIAAAVVVAATTEGKDEEAATSKAELELNRSIAIEDSSRVPLNEEKLEHQKILAMSPMRCRPSSTKQNRVESAMTINQSETFSETNKRNRRIVNVLAGVDEDSEQEYGRIDRILNSDLPSEDVSNVNANEMIV